MNNPDFFLGNVCVNIDPKFLSLSGCEKMGSEVINSGNGKFVFSLNLGDMADMVMAKGTLGRENAEKIILDMHDKGFSGQQIFDLLKADKAKNRFIRFLVYDRFRNKQAHNMSAILGTKFNSGLKDDNSSVFSNPHLNSKLRDIPGYGEIIKIGDNEYRLKGLNGRRDLIVKTDRYGSAYLDSAKFYDSKTGKYYVIPNDMNTDIDLYSDFNDEIYDNSPFDTFYSDKGYSTSYNRNKRIFQAKLDYLKKAAKDCRDAEAEEANEEYINSEKPITPKTQFMINRTLSAIPRWMNKEVSIPTNSINNYIYKTVVWLKDESPTQIQNLFRGISPNDFMLPPIAIKHSTILISTLCVVIISTLIYIFIKRRNEKKKISVESAKKALQKNIESKLK